MASSLYNEFLVQDVQSLRSVQNVHRWEESGIDLNERFEHIEPGSNIDQQACPQQEFIAARSGSRRQISEPG